MTNLRTVDDVIAAVKRTHRCIELPAPPYTAACTDDPRPRIALGVSSMRDHTTDEGDQLTEGLRHAGWRVFGHGYPEPHNLTDVRAILKMVDPAVVFVQDIREWSGGSFRDPLAKFTNVEVLAERPDIFKVGVVKDAHNSVEMCNESFKATGVHAFQHNYHPRIVKHVNPGVRTRHLIRAWHSVEPADVPPFDTHKREGCLMSGALSHYYPLRQRLFDNLQRLPQTTHHGHPGYRRDGCRTPELLDVMSRHKVAIVTSSIFGYSLRKFVESTSAGCVIVTDLPTDEKMPVIEENLIRVDLNILINDMKDVLNEAMMRYDPAKQMGLAERCMLHHDWRKSGVRLSEAIEATRRWYKG